MKKITELTEVRWKTVHIMDAYGNRERDREEYIAPREVRSVSPGPRLAHCVVDLIIFWIAITAVEYFLAFIIPAEAFDISLVFMAFLFNILWSWFAFSGYYLLCELLWQRTPGKFLTKTVVIDEYGNKPDLKTLILRSVIRLIPFEPFSCFDNYSHGWHDRWSKTWVVPEEELTALKRLQQEQSEGPAA